MIKKKHFIISLSSLTALTMPIALVVSCGTTSVSHNPSHPDKVVFIKEGDTFKGKNIDSTWYKWPASTTKITKDMFEGATISKDFIIPKTVKEIHENAFKNAKVSKDFRIPDSIEKIGAYSFENVELPVGFKMPLKIDPLKFDETAFSKLVTKDNATFDHWITSMPMPGSSIKKFNDIFKNDVVDVSTAVRTGKYGWDTIRYYRFFPYDEVQRIFLRHGEPGYGKYHKDRYNIGDMAYQINKKVATTAESFIVKDINDPQIKYFINNTKKNREDNRWTGWVSNDLQWRSAYIDGFTHSLYGAYLPKGFYIPRNIKHIAEGAFKNVVFNDDFHFEAPENIEDIGVYWAKKGNENLYNKQNSWKKITNGTYLQSSETGSFGASWNLSIDLRKFTKLKDWSKQIGLGSFYLATAKKLIIPKGKKTSTTKMLANGWHVKNFGESVDVDFLRDKKMFPDGVERSKNPRFGIYSRIIMDDINNKKVMIWTIPGEHLGWDGEESFKDERDDWRYIGDDGLDDRFWLTDDVFK